jgi:dethiobiotin synthetase
MNQRFFITSTGTGIGKSFITAALVRQAQAAGRSVAAYKPVISGFDPADVTGSDTGLLLESLGWPVTPDNIDRVSPWRYAAPLAPSMAARQENRPLDFHALVAHSQNAVQGPENVVLIEGVGGAMVPLNDRRTVLDWIEALGIPVLLVVGTYLGSISHTLTALSVLRQRHIPIHAVIVNESEDSSVSMAMTMNELKLWTEAPLLAIQYRVDGNWRAVTELRNLLQLS